MTKLLLPLLFLAFTFVLATSSSSGSFGIRQPPLFGIRAGADDAKAGDDADYDRAEKAIFRGIQAVEATVQKAVEDEVHLIFDAELEHDQRTQVAEHANQAVTKGVDKVKAMANDYSKARQTVFWPKDKQSEREEHQLLHAVEAAENAVLHAVQEEVDFFFHAMTTDEDHPLREKHPKETKKAKDTVKKGLKKAEKEVKRGHRERLNWMKALDSKAIEEYIESSRSMGL